MTRRSRWLSRLLLLLLAGAIISTPIARAEDGAPVEVTFVVDSVVDGADADLMDSRCAAVGTGACTLRAAVEQAVVIGSADNPVSIHFDPSLDSSTLALAGTAIDWQASYTVVDGAPYDITVDGAGMGVDASIFAISGSSNELRHLTLRNARGHAVSLGDLASTGTGNENRLSGLHIFGSVRAGVYVRGGFQGGSANRVENSRLGMPVDDERACIPGDGNTSGVVVALGAAGTVIAGNAIGCNHFDGVLIDGAIGSPSATQIRENRIGVNTGPASRGNGLYGIALRSSVEAVEIEDNLVAGNDSADIYVENTSNVTIVGNRIGLDAAGMAPLQEHGVGIYLAGSRNVTIGAASASLDQFIGGGDLGLWLRDAVECTVESSTALGVASDGLTPAGFAASAIAIEGVSAGNRLLPAVVRHSGGPGVLIGAGAEGNVVAPGAIGNNGGLPVDLAGDGYTVNDSDDSDEGANSLLNHPVLTDFHAGVAGGYAGPSDLIYVYRVEGELAAGGEADRLTTVEADGDGRWQLDLTALAVRFDELALLACERGCGTGANSSEFSPVLDKAEPVATADAFSVREDEALSGAPGVLANDEDPELNLLTAELVTSTLHGGLTFNSNGTFAYLPHADFYGEDRFTYRARDRFDQVSATATVTLTVLPVNDPPSAEADSAGISSASLAISLQTLLANDYDSDGDPLQIIAVSSTSAAGGRVLLDNGLITYTPPPGFSGLDSFTYIVSDGNGGTVTATVTVSVHSSWVFLPLVKR